ncbi:molybdopterin molybdotransferase MoeA [Chryseolinea sp. H1M3-3]|uniref:molybdopterin molybdotransferase MoeA n=1 Tax=Chryseolinea sp. H1M3-3 TaxID=3034144 RepID=UPI0023EBB360|nr:molybdopterin molybdotransferase MoeA [Chryseolinea sp. H1M3-3]
MVSVAEAADIIFSNLYKPAVESVPLQNSVNRVLAEKIIADRDFPPFDRVSMDGIAIQFRQWEIGQKEFVIEFTQAAGDEQKKLLNPEHCVEVMTGAMLPQQTDTVIRYEDLEITNKRARLKIEKLELGQNVHRKGLDCKQHDVLLTPGILLSPAEVALLASVGKIKVDVFQLPKTAIISSGDELVDVGVIPKAFQIRRSNTYAIEAAMHSMSWKATQFHFPDDKEILLNSLRTVLNNYDVLILSGGVSKGKFDYIPAVFEELGVRKLFHQVNQRPGKPFWFGASNEGKIIFALPGNPVSTYMCFYRYIKPWISKSMGIDVPGISATLSSDFSFAPTLTYFLQVAVKSELGKLSAYPEAGGGSGDFVNLKNVTGFLELPADQTAFSAGEIFPYFPFRNLV